MVPAAESRNRSPIHAAHFCPSMYLNTFAQQKAKEEGGGRRDSDGDGGGDDEEASQ